MPSARSLAATPPTLGGQLSVAAVSDPRRLKDDSHSPPPVPMSSIVLDRSAKTATLSPKAQGGGSRTSLVPRLVKSQPSNAVVSGSSRS